MNTNTFTLERMKRTAIPGLLILLGMLLASPMAAKNFTFEEHNCYLSLPDTGWVRDLEREKEDLGSSQVVFAARSSSGAKAIVLLVGSIDSRSERISSEYLRATCATIVNNGGRILDSGLTTFGGIGAMYFANSRSQAESGKSYQIYNICTITDGEYIGFVVIDRNGNAPNDSETLRIIESFGFLEAPYARKGIWRGSGDWWEDTIGGLIVLALAGAIFYAVMKRKKREQGAAAAEEDV